MKIIIKEGNIADFKCEAVVTVLFEGNTKLEGASLILDQQCGGVINDLLAYGDFEGKLFQSALLYPKESIPGKRILLMGMGKKEEFDTEKLRGVFSKAAQKIRELRIDTFALSLDFDSPNISSEEKSKAVAEGIFLGLYRFTPFKTIDREKEVTIKECTIVESDPALIDIISPAVQEAEIISDAVYLARDLVSNPSNEMTPTILAEKAREVASQTGMGIEVLDRDRMKELGMNTLLGVARGSKEPPQCIILQYNGGEKNDKPVALIGKGITFDSGGISIKPSAKMEEMKSDMAGGAAVIAAMKAAAGLKLPINVIGIIPATENLPGGNALKPGDILKSLSGQMVEVINTDAEGRLILADALTYAHRYEPAVIIDIATLTGACIIALGDNIIGMMGTDESLKKALQDASEKTGEPVWELPLWHEYEELIQSDAADVKNVGNRAAGTITAALFLKKFAGDYPWCHLDIAGPALLAKEKPYIPKGASGVGVKLFVQFLKERSRKTDEKNP
jgi:leucyl aminopeptidase